MDYIQCIVQYSGQWTADDKYENYKATGVLIPTSATYQELCELIALHLQQTTKDRNFQMQYRLQVDFQLFTIANDLDLKFYLQIKKNEPDFMKYPLYITILEKECSPTLENSQTTLDNDQNNNHEIISWTPRNFSNQVVTNDETNHDIEDTTRDIVGSIITHFSQELKHNPYVPTNTTMEIGVGYIFDNKEDMKTRIATYAIQNNFSYKVLKSCSIRYHLTCYNPQCTWMFKASRSKKSKSFVVRDFHNVHTCTQDKVFAVQKQARPRYIAKALKAKYATTKLPYGPLNIKEDFKLQFGIDLSYQTAWRAKEKIREMVLGNPSTSYAELPMYLFKLKQTNPGTITSLKAANDGTFEYAFFALYSSIEGYKHCRPQVVVDGAFLKQNYKGTLLTACTYDAAGHILPLAFGIVDSENNESYTWYFQRFRDAYGYRAGMCFISDRATCIAHALKIVYPDAGHYNCIYHILNNIRAKFRHNKCLQKIFFNAAKAYTTTQFDESMAELSRMNPQIVTYLQNLGYEHWSAIHSKEYRRQAMTSNIAESLNSRNSIARDLPVAMLLETLRSLCQQWNVMHRTEAANTFCVLTEKHNELILERRNDAAQMLVDKASDDLYEVTNEDKKYAVNIATKTCTCMIFQTDELPCKHALAVLLYCDLNPYDFCSYYYKNTAFKATYNNVINPISAYNESHIPVEVSQENITHPKVKQQPGKPRKRRFKPYMEKRKKRNLCGNCHQANHNKRTCNHPPVLTI